MTLKARLSRLERVIGATTAGESLCLIWVAAIDPSGTINAGWADPEEYARWHPRERVREPAPESNDVAFQSGQARRRVTFVTAIADCSLLDCPWHGPANRHLASVGVHLGESPRPFEGLLEAIRRKGAASATEETMQARRS